MTVTRWVGALDATPDRVTTLAELATERARVDTLAGRVEYIRDYVTPAIHGAQGRGIAGDETAAIQAWALDANPNKALDGEYEVSGEIAFASGSQVLGNGKILSTVSTDTSYAVSCAGSTELIGTVSATIGAFTATVALDGGQTINEGDWLAIRDAADGSWAGVTWPGERSYYRAGEPIRVAHVLSATSLITATAIRASYSGVELYRINAARFAWDGPTIETAGAYALAIETVLAPRISGTFFGSTRAALSLMQTIGGVLERSTIDCRAAAAGTQYGLLGSGMHGTRVVACEIYGRRHGTTLGGSGWPNRDVVYDNCRIGSDGVIGWVSADTHGNSEKTTYRNCEIGGGLNAGGRGTFVSGGSIGGDYGCIQFGECIGGSVFVRDAKLYPNGAFAGGIIRGSTTSHNLAYLIEPLQVTLADCNIEIRNHTEENLMTLYQRGHTRPVDLIIKNNVFRGVNPSIGRILRTTLFSGAPLSRRIEVDGNVREDAAGALLTGTMVRLEGGYQSLGDGVLRIQDGAGAWVQGGASAGSSIEAIRLTSLPATINPSAATGDIISVVTTLDAEATNASVEYPDDGDSMAMRQVTLGPPTSLDQRLDIFRIGAEPIHLLGTINANAAGLVVDDAIDNFIRLVPVDIASELSWRLVSQTPAGGTFETVPPVAIDRAGAAHTVLEAEFGRELYVDANVTLPVVPADLVGRRVDLINTGGSTVSIVSATGVTTNGANSIDALAAASAIVKASDGATTTYIALGGKA